MYMKKHIWDMQFSWGPNVHLTSEVLRSFITIKHLAHENSLYKAICNSSEPP